MSATVIFALLWPMLTGFWGLALALNMVALGRAAPPDRRRQALKLLGAALMLGYFGSRVLTGVPHTAEGGEAWLWIRNLGSLLLAAASIWDALVLLRRTVDTREGRVPVRTGEARHL